MDYRKPSKLMNIAVSNESFLLAEQAKQLAKRLNLPFIELPNEHHNFLLVFTEQHLELRNNLTKRQEKPIYVDFSSQQQRYRVQHSGKRKEMIARAVGLKPNLSLRVLDTTAGLGQDAFVLANLGCKVHMLERSPIIAALLEDGLLRLKEILPQLKLSLTNINSLSYLQDLLPNEYPDVIYLDPMYPERNKTALSKKEMRWLRILVGDDTDAKDLLPVALARAQKRVVVKRPRLAETLTTDKPSLTMQGQSCRFDIYLV